jgi:predicted PurR-regulated permease PerM
MDLSTRKRTRPVAAAAGEDPTRVGLTAVASIIIAVLTLLAAMSYASALLAPIVAGLTVGFILGPLADRAARLGVPSLVTNGAIVAAVLATIWLISGLIVPIVADVVNRGPELAATIRDKLGALERSLGDVGDLALLLSGDVSRRSLNVRIETGQVAAVASVLGAVTPAFAQLVIFVFTMLLFLVSRRSLRDRAVLAMRRRENRLATLRIFSAIEDRMLGYFGTVTLINLGLGVATGLVLFAIGIPGAAIWGFLAFVLNFMPVVGPLIVKALLLGGGILLMPTLAWSLAPLGLYLVLQIAEANFITPWLVGRRLTLEPLLIFLAIVFFTFLWGPVGAFLATPIVIVGLIIHQHATPDATIPLPDREELPRPGGVDQRTSNSGAKS